MLCISLVTSTYNPCCIQKITKNFPIFKRLFTDSSPEGKKALQSFLEAVLQKQVSNIVLQPEEIPINSVYDKKSRFDLNCEIDKTEYANIEMQNYNCQEMYEKRASARNKRRNPICSKKIIRKRYSNRNNKIYNRLNR